MCELRPAEWLCDHQIGIRVDTRTRVLLALYGEDGPASVVLDELESPLYNAATCDLALCGTCVVRKIDAVVHRGEPGRRTGSERVTVDACPYHGGQWSQPLEGRRVPAPRRSWHYRHELELDEVRTEARELSRWVLELPRERR